MTSNPFDHVSRRQTLTAILAAALVPGMARNVRAADFTAFNAGYAKSIVLPAFERLAGASTVLSDVAALGCQDPARPDMPAMRDAFHVVADSWADAQMFRLGPLAESQRAERFAYWPERRNIVDKQLSALLSDPGTATLTAAKLGDSSVAVQGLPALERLLFNDAPLSATGCAVVTAIAGNLQQIALEAVAAWETALTVAAAPFAANATEATTQFYTNILTLLQVIADQKIGGPLGSDLAAARPKMAEQWRSGRSLRNIRRNLTAAQRGFFEPGGFAGFLKADQQDLKDRLSMAFADANTIAEQAGDDLPGDVADAGRRDHVTLLLVKVNHLRDIIRQDVPQVIGITLGFNELDGDGS